MLEHMREQTGSFIIWILFAIIIAAFVLFFGSPSDSLGCGTTITNSVEVGDEGVSENSWRFAYNSIPFAQQRNVPGEQRRVMAMEMLIQREILAQAAEKMGFRVSTDLVDRAISNGEFYIMGSQLDGTRFYFPNTDEGTYFDFKYLQNFVSRLGLPNVRAYKHEQKREMLAYFMRQEILKNAHLSEEEARRIYVDSNTTVSADYVKFDVARYRSEIEIDEALVNAFIAEHQEELKSEWDQVKPRWESDKARVKARIIKVAKSEEAGGKTMAAAQKRLEGGESFAEVARDVSEDNSARLGGLIGWRAADSLGFGPEVVDAVAKVEAGKTSDVIETDRFLYLVHVEEKSDKGLSFEDKKFDLAAKMAPDELAKKKARQAAEDALARAQNTPLSELFEAAPQPDFDFNNLPPEIRNQLTPEQIEQIMRDAAESQSGALIREGRTRLAQAGGSAEPADEEKAAPAKAAPKKAAPAPEKAAPAKAAPAKAAPEKADKQPAPESEPAPAATAESAEPESTEAGAAGDGEPSDAKPALQSVRGLTRNGDLVGELGKSKELAEALFEELAAGELGPKVYEVGRGSSFVVVQLVDRTEADMEKFKESASELQNDLSESKGQQILAQWISQRCQKLNKAGSIEPNYALLTTGEKQIPYEPCSMLTPP